MEFISRAFKNADIRLDNGFIRIRGPTQISCVMRIHHQLLKPDMFRIKVSLMYKNSLNNELITIAASDYSYRAAMTRDHRFSSQPI